jgi:hypothetical protein
MLNRNTGIVGFALSEYPVCGDKLKTKLKKQLFQYPVESKQPWS